MIPNNPAASMFSIMEQCQRIQQEFQTMERKYTTSKLELSQLKEQKAELQEHFQKYFSLSSRISWEVVRREELLKRLNSILSDVSRDLSPEKQDALRQKLADAHNLTMDDMKKRAEAMKKDPLLKPILVFNADPNFEQSIEASVKKQKISSSSFVPVAPNREMKTPVELKPEVPNPQKTADPMIEDDEGKKKRGRTSPMRSESPSPLMTMLTGTPRTSKQIASLQHGEVVCSVLFESGNRIFTGGKGAVKLWDLNSVSKPISEMRCLNDSYIRTCKLMGKNLIIGGESNTIVLWDLETPAARLKASWNTGYSSCYSTSVGENGIFSSHNDGGILMWDANSGNQIRSFVGHKDDVSSIEVSPDGSKLVSAGLDGTLRVWDIGTAKEIGSYMFPTQIFSMAICPGESWVAVGLENHTIEVMNLMNSSCKYQLHLHEGPVLSIKFANSSKWFVTTGKDKLLTCWRSPFGGSLFTIKETNSVLSSDISSDDTLMVVGSGDCLANVYEMIY